MRPNRCARTFGLTSPVLGALLVLSLGAAVNLTGCTMQSKTAQRQSASGEYAFWPLPPDEPRVQFIRSFRTSDDLRREQRSGLSTLVFGEDEIVEVVEKPYGVDMRNGKIYVCDIRSPSLTVFDLANGQLRLVGTTGVNRVSHPVDVAVADDGWIFVADNERDAILVYSPSERFERAIGVPGMKPVSVAVHGDKIYACDIKGQCIQIFNRRSWEHLGSFGSVGDEDGQFRVPLGVDVDKDGYVYVSDMMRARMQKFTPDGEFVDGFGQLGDVAGYFARPKQIAVDSDGILYVVDASFQNVQMFNSEHELLMSFGAAGNFPGAMNLPAGVAVSDEQVPLLSGLVHPGFKPTRYIVVTNQFGLDKVNVYALGGLREGYTVADLAPAAAPVGTGVSERGATPIQSQGDEPEPVPTPAPQQPASDDQAGPEPNTSGNTEQNGG